MYRRAASAAGEYLKMAALMKYATGRQMVGITTSISTNTFVMTVAIDIEVLFPNKAENKSL